MSLSEKFRQQAKQQREAANVLLKSDKFEADVTLQISVTVALCEANMLVALADVLDHLGDTVPTDMTSARRKAIIARNNDVRNSAARAAITGDWDEFDRLAANAGSPGGA